MTELKTLSCEEFIAALASKTPAPGGGGASALVGALAIALGNMLGSLTVGKAKYAAVEEEMLCLKAQADQLQAEFLILIDADAAAFMPLAKAYGLPKDTEQEQVTRAHVLDKCLIEAAAVPLKIMEKCCEAIDLLQGFADKGAAIAISDAGVGAAFAKAALQGAVLNVFINAQAMTDRELAKSINDQAFKMLDEYLAKADAIYSAIAQQLA